MLRCCNNIAAQVETHYRYGPLDGIIRMRHICGTHLPPQHLHTTISGHLFEFDAEELSSTGFWSHCYLAYALACNDVDNFATVTYNGERRFLHGHKHKEPCHCWEIAVE